MNAEQQDARIAALEHDVLALAKEIAQLREQLQKVVAALEALSAGILGAINR